MKHKMIIAALFCSIFLAVGCERDLGSPIEVPIEIAAHDTSKYLSLYWDSEILFSRLNKIEFAYGKVVVAQYDPLNVDSSMMAFNAHTGNLDWTFTLPGMYSWGGSSTALQIRDKIVTYNTKTLQYGIIGIDVLTGTPLWSMPQGLRINITV